MKTLRAFCLILLLTACGFTPLYGTPGGGDAVVAARLDQVAIGSIPDESGQYLRNALIDRFYRNGRPADTRYALEIKPIVEVLTNLDITRNSTTTRQQIRLTTTMILTDRTTGKELLDDKLLAVNSFNVLQSQYDTRVSRQYVRDNALDDLAHQIEVRLALYFKRAGQ